MAGEEASFIVVSDGQHVLPLATSQDHKRIGDGDSGPNTGGMGAYSPAPVVTPNVHARAMHEIVLPTIAGMAADGHPVLRLSLCRPDDRRCGQSAGRRIQRRLGDPETQPILMRLKTDLIDLLMAATATGDQARSTASSLQWDRRVALGVVMAAHGYPVHAAQAVMPSAACPPRPMMRSSSTPAPNAAPMARWSTSGGRVLCVTALGDSVKAAQQRAYAALAPIHFDGAQYRSDIGHRAVKR